MKSLDREFITKISLWCFYAALMTGADVRIFPALVVRSMNFGAGFLLCYIILVLPRYAKEKRIKAATGRKEG